MMARTGSIGRTFAFGAAMALAGFLSFQVQLILAKYMLPWFGGSAWTWLISLLFFQCALLAGYGYAYGLTRLVPPRVQVLLHTTLLFASLVWLPITPAEGFKPVDASDPTWRILGLLAASVGLPYVLLATTTPLVSVWLSRVDPGRDIAPFFAASNAGSFLGLLSYPFLFEPLLSSLEQTQIWSIAYVAFSALICLTGCLAWRTPSLAMARPASPGSSGGAGPALGQAFLLSALGSCLLLAASNAVTQWSAVVPFLWVLPLSCYLLTFVLAFSSPRFFKPVPLGLTFLILAAANLLLLQPPVEAKGLVTRILLSGVLVFTGCMICHGRLAALQRSVSDIALFYLAVAAGGAFGGVATVLLAPTIFSSYLEIPLSLCLVALLALWGVTQSARHRLLGAAGGTVAALLFVAALTLRLTTEYGQTDESIRNFYGVVKIVRVFEDDPDEFRLALVQSGADQGGQYQSAGRRSAPVCGFEADRALGLALAHSAKRRADPTAALRIGVIGLGAGFAATLGRSGDVIRFYELNPAVYDLSARKFSFLSGSAARTEFVFGDGRLLLERERPAITPPFDVLVLDAFRGAAPPLHLMTKEAFDVYLAHLATNGILAVNFSVDTFEVAPLHRGLAEQFGLQVQWFETADQDRCSAGTVSWALYTRDAGFFDVSEVKAASSQWPDGSQTKLLWTDQNSSLMSLLGLRGR